MPTALADYPLRIIDLAFSSPLTDVAMELEHFRRLELSGDTPSAVFFQLKDIFHSLESLGSTRFEVDTSMLDDFIASKIENTPIPGDHIQMISNVERAMAYVDEVVHVGDEITEQLICELHRMSVNGLSHEGDEILTRCRRRIDFAYAQARVSNSSIAPVMRSPSCASVATFSPN